MNAQPLPRLAFKQHEAAQVLGISDRTLRDWMKGANPPPSFRRGKVLLFSAAALNVWMDERSRDEEKAD